MLTTSQIIAIVIFVLMFAALASDKVPRHIAALIGAILMILIVFLGTMREPAELWKFFNLTDLGRYRFWVPGLNAGESLGFNWQTIIFIGTMMITVGWISSTGLFRWLCLFTARLVKCRPVPIMISFMILSGFLSMFIGSITVMLFLSLMTIELGRLLRFNPVPLIIAEIFASNVGGAATLSGDPPNIIVGTCLGYKFSDFIANTGEIAWIAMILAILYFYFIFRKSLNEQVKNPEELLQYVPLPSTAVTNPLSFRLAIAVFVLIIGLLATHAYTGLSVAAIGVITAVLSLVIAGKHSIKLLKDIDWRTLLFFTSLFFCVGGLEVSGVLVKVSTLIHDLSGSNTGTAIALILWISAIVSAFVDNIPFAAAMVPVIVSLSNSGIGLPAMAWSLSLGTDIGGNATPIGASANVIGLSTAEKEGYRIGWGKYLKYALVPTIAVIGLCHLLLIWRYA